MPWITRDQDVALQNFNSAITGNLPAITVGGNGTDALAFIGQANGGLNVSDGCGGIWQHILGPNTNGATALMVGYLIIIQPVLAL
jgi:hypothetical protein